MTVSIKEYDFRRIFYIEKAILSLFGFYPDDATNSSIWCKVKATVFFISVTLYVAQMCMLMLFYSFDEMIKPSMIWVTELGFICKLIVFLYRGSIFFKLEADLEKPIFYGFSEYSLAIIKKDIDFTKKITNIYRFGIFFYISYLCICKLFFNGRDMRELIVEAYLPCSLENNFCYVSFFGFQIINSYITSTTNITMECLFCKIATICCSLFDSLQISLKEIDYKENKMAKEELRQNVVLHMELLRFIDEIDNIFNLIAFFQCFTSTFAICITLYQIMLVPSMSLEFLGLVNYLMCMLIQIAIFCFFGNNIMKKNENIREACFMSNWYESDDITIRKTLSIIMERTKRPFVMKAGGFFTLSIGTFTSILKSSYSFLGLLSNMYN